MLTLLKTISHNHLIMYHHIYEPVILYICVNLPNQTEGYNMHTVANTQINQPLSGMGNIFSVNLVSELLSGRVYAAVSGFKSDETHIVDVSSEFQFPFQRKDHQISNMLLNY